MSNTFLENQENINVPDSKRIKISHGLRRPVPAPRTVLGNLNGTSNLRIQPRRAAKQSVKYERSYSRLAEKRSFGITSGLAKVQTQPFLTNLPSSRDAQVQKPTYPSITFAQAKKVFSNPSSISSLSQSQKISNSNTTTSSGFTIYTDASSSSGVPSFNANTKGILPSSSFATNSTSNSSESRKDDSGLSAFANLPPLPKPPVGNSTTLSDCIKQTLKVSDTNVRPISICNKENEVYCKSKVALPNSFNVCTSNDEDKENNVAMHSTKVSHLLSSKKLTRSTDYSLCEEILLDQSANCLWAESLYGKHTYNHLRVLELKHRPKSNYIQKQAEITSNMRWILIDWLVEVASEYDLHSKTLYLAVSYVDRFLSFMSVKRDKLQLVGTTAMFIAAKYEEIYPPEAKQFAYITDNTYRISQIIKMEQLILRVLSFDVSNPTILDFTDTYASMCNSDKKTTHLCQFIAELSMLECEQFLKYAPSIVAASALALANHTLDLPTWPEEVRIGSGYELGDLKDCYINLNKSYHHVNIIKTHAIREKYRVDSFNYVSEILPSKGSPWS